MHFVVLLGWADSDRVFRTFDPWQPALVEAPEEDVRSHFTGKGLLVANKPLPPLRESLLPAPVSTEWGLWSLGALNIWLFGVLGFELSRWRHFQVQLKKWWSVVWVSGFTVMLSSCSAGNPGLAENVDAAPTDAYDYDTGLVLQGTSIRHTFRVFNPTAHPVKIERVEST